LYVWRLILVSSFGIWGEEEAWNLKRISNGKGCIYRETHHHSEIKINYLPL
jgi:hypothetical protein